MGDSNFLNFWPTWLKLLFWVKNRNLIKKIAYDNYKIATAIILDNFGWKMFFFQIMPQQPHPRGWFYMHINIRTKYNICSLTMTSKVTRSQWRSRDHMSYKSQMIPKRKNEWFSDQTYLATIILHKISYKLVYNMWHYLNNFFFLVQDLTGENLEKCKKLWNEDLNS